MTINDIAKLAGVSRSTVSRVLTNNPDVNFETREKVLKIIEENNYQPSSIARGLAKGKINVVALIVEDIRNPFYSELTWIIEKELSKNGYMVVLCVSEYDPKKEILYLETANQYGFSGVVMVSAIESNSLKSILKSMKCPVILLNRYLQEFDGDVLITDDFEGGYLATRHLIGLGHRRIGILTGSLDFNTHRERHSGYVNALGAFHIEYNNKYTVQGDLTMQAGIDYGLSLLKMKEDMPTAVFVTMDIMAMGVIEAFKREGRSIPRDLSIVGFDDIPVSSTISINLTTIRHAYSEIGEKAVELLLTRIENKALESRKVILNPTLIIRGTTSVYKA